jgi:hypothetical protein
MRPIAIRLFENKVFGTTYGKGLRRSAVFNATAEVGEPYAKYLLDFESSESWMHHAKTASQVALVDKAFDQIKANEETLWSWVKWYDKHTGDKEYVDGFAFFDPSTEQVMLSIADPKRNLEWDWALPARRCQGTAGRNSPAFLATNYDLTH